MGHQQHSSVDSVSWDLLSLLSASLNKFVVCKLCVSFEKQDVSGETKNVTRQDEVSSKMVRTHFVFTRKTV